MATEDTAPKRSGLGWIPKLSLWAVVIAFGYLYLSSVDRDSTEVAPGSDVVAESAAEAGGFQKIVDKVGELTASAENVLADVTAAGADGFEKVVAGIKDLTGSADAPVEGSPNVDTVAAAEASAVETAAPSAGAPAVADAVSEEVVPPAAPVAHAPMPSDRPAASGFVSHYAPLPGTGVGRAPLHQADEPSEGAVTAESAPMADAEATVFAESLMRDAPAEAAPAAVPGASVAAAPVQAPTSASTPPPFPPQAYAPMPLLPVMPQPFAETNVAPAPSMPEPAAAASDRRQDAAAQYQARMRAEYENMRRVADQRAREYWERMQQMPAPVAAPMGYPAYGPPYGPGFVTPAYPR
jgi:hypothetical protein